MKKNRWALVGAGLLLAGACTSQPLAPEVDAADPGRGTPLDVRGLEPLHSEGSDTEDTSRMGQGWLGSGT